MIDSLKVTDEQLLHMMHILEEEMTAGLSPSTHKQATVKMFPTYVRNIPDGTEVGHVLALDLGGTNFRVLLIDLHGNGKVELTPKTFIIPQSIMLGDGRNVRIRRSSSWRMRETSSFSFSYSVIWQNVCMVLWRNKISCKPGSAIH